MPAAGTADWGLDEALLSHCPQSTWATRSHHRASRNALDWRWVLSSDHVVLEKSHTSLGLLPLPLPRKTEQVVQGLQLLCHHRGQPRHSQSLSQGQEQHGVVAGHHFISASQPPDEGWTLIVPIPQTEKLRHRVTKSIPQGSKCERSEPRMEPWTSVLGRLPARVAICALWYGEDFWGQSSHQGRREGRLCESPDGRGEQQILCPLASFPAATATERTARPAVRPLLTAFLLSCFHPVGTTHLSGGASSPCRSLGSSHPKLS